jgi:HEAT repeat protein
LSDPLVGTGAVKALLGVLTDEHSLVRSKAAGALDNIIYKNGPTLAVEEGVLEGLIRALSDDDVYVRTAALDALNSVQVWHGSHAFKDTQVVNSALSMLDESDENARRAGVHFLGMLMISDGFRPGEHYGLGRDPPDEEEVRRRIGEMVKDSSEFVSIMAEEVLKGLKRMTDNEQGA